MCSYETLRKEMRVLHQPEVGQYAIVCSQGCRLDGKPQPWPCESAQFVHSRREIRDLLASFRQPQTTTYIMNLKGCDT